MAKNILQLQNDIANNLETGVPNAIVEVRSILNDMLDFAESLDSQFYGIFDTRFLLPTIDSSDDGAWCIVKGDGIFEAEGGAWIIILQSAPLLPNLLGQANISFTIGGPFYVLKPTAGDIDITFTLAQAAIINNIDLAGGINIAFSATGDLNPPA